VPTTILIAIKLLPGAHCNNESVIRRSLAAEPELQSTINALSSPVRREILWRLWDGERAAGEIAAGCHVTPGTVSTHLAALRRAGLVSVRADGNFRYYRIERTAMEAALPLLASSDDKWVTADDIPERDLAAAFREHWVTVTTDVDVDPATAYASFADGERYSAWLGVPVTIEDRRFSAELEWGTRVRGRYEVLAPPDLIAMRWDFDDGVTPVPGRQVVGYLRFFPRDHGCRVEVHQCAADAKQADFLIAAWSMVLGRFAEYAALGRGAPRTKRPKRTR
jgi:DNA-binding transcriptional ArsR family regulator/uncharacterized protein YndB with AHSA1/START domain